MTKENPNTIPSNYIPGQDPLDDYIAEQQGCRRFHPTE